MANNVKTVVRLEGSHAVLEKLLRKVVSSAAYILRTNTRNNTKIMDITYAVIPREVGKVDFNILVPQPPYVYQGGINNEIKKTHGVCWDDWRKKNWGTTRNAHNDSVEWIDDTTVQITVWKDWTRHTERLTTIAKKALEQGIVNMEGEYADEDFGGEMGYIHINEDWYEDKESEDPICFAACNEDVECYNKVWGEGMAETTGYFDNKEE